MKPFKSKYRVEEALANLQPVHLAWLAGVVEGEGCIAVDRFKVKSRDNQEYYRVFVGVVNTSWRMIERVLELCPGRLHIIPARKYSNARDCYRWELSGNNAQLFLRAIRPYVASKLDQIDAVLTVCLNTPRLKLSTSEWDTRRKMYESLKALKGLPQASSNEVN